MTILNKEEIVAQLVLHQLWFESGGKEGKQLGVDEFDFRNIDLAKFQLNHAYVTACIFDGMNLSDKDMSSSLLCSSTFKCTNLENVDFYKADVSYADFTYAKAENARFAKSDCSETVFTKAELTNAKLIACSLYLTDFRDAILHNVDVSSSSFEGTLLKGARLKGIKGLDEAVVKSINIGAPENKMLLEGEEARMWLMTNNLKE